MQSSEAKPLNFFGCSGDMAERMAAFDWMSTPLGDPERWSPSLKAAIRIALRSRFAMWMCWGPELTFFCNDAYRPTLGVKADWALGAPASRVWAEIWADIGPRIERVLRLGEATWDEGLLLYLERSGVREETYHTFSYSPLTDDDGSIHGMLCVVTEETTRVINEQRVRFLSSLASQLGAIVSETDVLACTRAHLETARSLLPAAMLYLVPDSAGESAEPALAMSTGIPPELIDDVDQRVRTQWPLVEIMRHGTPQLRRVAETLSDLPLRSAAQQLLQSIVLIPLKGQSGGPANGVLLAAVNPDQPYNAGYEDFLKLLAGNIAASLISIRAYEAERRRVVQLAELDTAKTVFFSNISHEFRTPLTLMLGPTESALESPERALGGTDLEMVHRNELRLLKLVNALLDFSRIEAGRFDVNREPTDLAQYTAELASVFESAATQAGLRLTIDCVMPHPVSIDRNMWEKILLNLLSNALKHTEAGGITVTLRGDEGGAVLTVADTGSGIAAADLPHIFERFRRAQGAGRRTHEGTGIGLALVRELVGLLDGEVGADSQPGLGTTFTVRVAAPASAVPASTAAVRSRAIDAYTREAEQWQLPARELPAAEAASGLRPSVLVADDNADMRGYIVRLLKDRFEVLEAADGREALQLIRARQPKLVLSDVMMPRLDGFELLRAVRDDALTATTPVVLLSARSGEEARIEGLAAGADDYITKPFSARELVARVSAVLTLAEFRAEAQRTEGRLIRERDSVLESINEGFALLDADWRVLRVNRAAIGLLAKREDELIGQSIWTLYPEIVETPYGDSLRKAMRERTPALVENFYEAWQRWYEISLYPHGEDSLAIYFRDITEHRRALAALYEADRRKDEFLATLAHELRNPLAPIRNAATILESRDLSPDAVRRTVAILHRQIHHMSRLLDDLLDVSRITTGKLVLRLETVPLLGVIDAAIETARPLIETFRHRFRVEIEEPLPAIRGDAVRLTQVVTNLLTNAAKYTEPGGEIALAVRRLGDRVTLEVRDNGLGLEPGQQAGIFEMFSQVNSSLERAQGGSASAWPWLAASSSSTAAPSRSTARALAAAAASPSSCRPARRPPIRGRRRRRRPPLRTGVVS